MLIIKELDLDAFSNIHIYKRFENQSEMKELAGGITSIPPSTGGGG